VVATILLIPEPGDPRKLLAAGPCGARPPMAYRRPGILDVGLWRFGHVMPYHIARRALVLAHEGHPVAEGICRGRIALEWVPSSALEMWVRDMLHGDTRFRADVAAFGGLGTLVLLDADGVEVAP